MSCTQPLTAYETGYVWPESGKPKLGFNPAKSIDGKVIPLPCGQCPSCRLTKSKQWAFRCMCEADMHEENHFLTLTYDQESLPRDLSLHKSHWQKFIRAVRDKYRDTHPKIRFFMCGEYGEASHENNWIPRPHFHALIFGFNFPDQKYLYTHKSGDKIFDSESAKKLWGRGSIEIGTINTKSASYVARYCLKKVNGRENLKTKDPKTGLYPYERWNPFTTEKNYVLPEFTQMSLRPGIGAEWYKQFKKDIYPSGRKFIGQFAPFPGDKAQNMFMKVPPYFDKLLEKERPDMMEHVSESRKQHAKDNAHNYTPEKLNAKAIIINQRIEQYERKL